MVLEEQVAYTMVHFAKEENVLTFTNSDDVAIENGGTLRLKSEKGWTVYAPGQWVRVEYITS